MTALQILPDLALIAMHESVRITPGKSDFSEHVGTRSGVMHAGGAGAGDVPDRPGSSVERQPARTTDYDNFQDAMRRHGFMPRVRVLQRRIGSLYRD